MTTIRTDDVPFKLGRQAKTGARNPYPLASGDAARWEAGYKVRLHKEKPREPMPYRRVEHLDQPKVRRREMDWSEDDDNKLRRFAAQGMMPIDMLPYLSRSESGITKRGYAIGIQWRVVAAIKIQNAKLGKQAPMPHQTTETTHHQPRGA